MLNCSNTFLWPRLLNIMSNGLKLVLKNHFLDFRLLFTSGEGHNNKQETMKYEDQCSNSYCSNIELGSQSPIRCQTKQTSGDIFDGFQEDKRKYSKSLDVLSSAFLSCTITFTISSGPPRDFKENLPYLSNLIR
ncbi:hypothetical protein RDI58_015418 [Solanum bulbocastanum]|uniref:Uncharacterized protein n=1 Tax=Solanum bulbocastanum TaxID=147425 RepID=A0AAN8TLJ2_SOLBU